jgi:hypothetical protein
MLRIHRQQRNLFFPSQRNQQRSCANQRFLVCQCQSFPRLNGRQRRRKPRRPDHRGHHHIHIIPPNQISQRGSPTIKFHAQFPQQRRNFLGRSFITDRHRRRPKSPDLLDQLVGLFVSGQRRNTVGRSQMLHDFQRIAADGTRGTQNRDSFVQAVETISARSIVTSPQVSNRIWSICNSCQSEPSCFY